MKNIKFCDNIVRKKYYYVIAIYELANHTTVKK